jgi:hypothetical protein
MPIRFSWRGYFQLQQSVRNTFADLLTETEKPISLHFFYLLKSIIFDYSTILILLSKVTIPIDTPAPPNLYLASKTGKYLFTD